MASSHRAEETFLAPPGQRFSRGPCARTKSGPRIHKPQNILPLTFPHAPPTPRGPPRPPPDPPRGRAWRPVRVRGVRRLAGADCAVGSGEWAEPPHSPWTLRRRVQKCALFDPFLSSDRGSKRGHFLAFLGSAGTPEDPCRFTRHRRFRVVRKPTQPNPARWVGLSSYI